MQNSADSYALGHKIDFPTSDDQVQIENYDTGDTQQYVPVKIEVQQQDHKYPIASDLPPLFDKPLP